MPSYPRSNVHDEMSLVFREERTSAGMMGLGRKVLGEKTNFGEGGGEATHIR